jgi:EAL domain-containing protein (putative c-di-GMP-specific phosphodiesterase class I)
MQAATLKLQQHINDNDVLGSFSNNSFLLLSLFDKTQSTLGVAEKLRRCISDLDGLLQGKTYSRVCGIIIDKYCNSAEQAVARLEDNFKQAQESKLVVKIDSTQFQHMPGSHSMDQVWARRISTLLKNNRLSLLSQTMISLQHDDWDRACLHLDLRNDLNQNISVEDFKKTVTQTGLASSVDRWIIFNAAEKLHQQLQINPNSQFFIPLIGDAIRQEQLYPWLEKVMAQFKIPANCIMLESSVESALMHPQKFSHHCQAMSDINCGVYITGLDDPTITHQLYDDSKNRINYLALNSKLLDGLLTDRDDHEAIETLVAQCHRENTLTVVPDVMEAKTLSELWRLGVDLIISDTLLDPADDPLELDLTATLNA